MSGKSRPAHPRSNKYATFKSITTKTITVEGGRRDMKKAKLFIGLNRSKDFFKVLEQFNKIREENAATEGH